MDEDSKSYKLKMFINECKRVLRVTKRPDSFEFKTIVKVSGIGMGLIGLVGFLVSMIKNLLSGGV
jgi:protein transport protein SEC61 subunit gamma-like protein